MKNINNT